MPDSTRPDPSQPPGPDDRAEACPTDEQLAALSVGSLAPEDEATLIAHLDHCAKCCERLEALDGPMPPRAALGRWSSIEMAPPALAALLSRWRRESPDADEISTPGRGVGAGASASDKPDRSSKMETDYVLHMLRTNGPPVDPQYLCRLGRYDVIEVVGQGGMAIVLKARDVSLQRITAIKILRPHMAADPLARKRFVREGQAVAAVRDPHVIGVYAVEEDAPLPYLVMEFVEGSSLQERLDKQGPPPLPETLRIGRQIAAGLAAAHAQGLVHRDVKPANVLLENGAQRVKISDFGLARQANATMLTESGVVAGTPAYMSPEQVHGEPLDPRSDLFSLGSVLYTLCTGRPPFVASTLLSTMRRVAEDPAPAVRNLNASTPPWLADVIFKLHQKKPDDRFHTAEEVEAVLSQGLAYLQQPSGAPEPARIYSHDAAEKKGRAEPSSTDSVKNADTHQHAAIETVAAAPTAPAQKRSGLPLLLAIVAAAAVVWLLRDSGRTPSRPEGSNESAATHRVQSTTVAQGTTETHGTSEATTSPRPAPNQPLREPRDGNEPLATLMAPFVGHTGTVSDLAFSPNGALLASASGRSRGDRSLRIWDATNPADESDAPRTLETTKRAYTARNSVGKAYESNSPRQVHALRWLPNGKSLLAAGAFDDVLEVDATETSDTPRIVRFVRVAQGSLSALAIASDGQEFYCAGEDGVIRKYNLSSGELLASLWAPAKSPDANGRPAPVTELDLSPNGARLVSCSRDSVVRVWDTSSHKVVWESSHAPSNIDARFADDERVLIASDALRLYDVRNGQQLWASEKTSVSGLAIDEPHNLIAACSPTGVVELYDLIDGRLLERLASGDSRTCIAFSPNGASLVAAGGEGVPGVSPADYRLVRWHMLRQGPKPVSPRAGESSAPAPRSAAEDGRQIAGTLNADLHKFLVDPSAGLIGAHLAHNEAPKAPPAFKPDESPPALLPIPLAPMFGHTGMVVSADFSPSGELLATCSGYFQSDDSVRLWDATAERGARSSVLSTKGREYTAPMGPPVGESRRLQAGQAHVVKFLPDGKSFLVAGVFDHVLQVEASLDDETLRVLKMFHVKGGAVESLALTRDVKSFFVGCEDGKIRRISFESGETISEWSAPAPWATDSTECEDVVSLDVNPAGDRLVAASLDRVVRIWDTATGKVVREWPAQPTSVSRAKFIDDGRLVICSDSLLVVDAMTGETIWKVAKAHATDAAVDLAHNVIVSCGAKGGISAWELTTGRPLGQASASERRECIALSPDGTQLVSGGGVVYRAATEDRLLHWRVSHRGLDRPGE